MSTIRVSVKIFVLTILLLPMFPLILKCQRVVAADSTINMSVSVVGRKPTDTINDFTFLGMSTSNDSQGKVAGAATQSSSRAGDKKFYVFNILSGISIRILLQKII
jgi:hypothetical protein